MSDIDRTYLWTGRTDDEDGEAGKRWHQAIQHYAGDLSGTALLGFECDLGVAANKGRPGACQGPDAIRTGLSSLAWHGKSPIVDYGNVAASDNLEAAQSMYATQLAHALTDNKLVIALGGGHEIAWGSYQGLKLSLAEPQQRIGIVNFDAHFDLRAPAPETSSGTPFWQIAQDCDADGRAFEYCCLGVSKASNTKALFMRANQLGCQYLLDTEFDTASAETMLTPMLERIDVLYLTICLDVFSASVAPGVSAPAALGIAPGDVIKLIYWLSKQKEKLGFFWPLADIAEMNPMFDQDQRTAKLAARLVFELHQASQQA